MLEGLVNSSYWDWKNSIGPLENRPGYAGVWGYQQTNGLGLMEYLELSEDMGLELGEFEQDSNQVRSAFLLTHD